MSASLVGSEMCIRDRDGTHAVAPRHIEQALDDAWGQRRLIAHWNGPVSYTHLTLPTICSV
eukprot:13408617-Alexandrium_andersonii.AAC.1